MEFRNNLQLDVQNRTGTYYIIALAMLCGMVFFYGLSRLPFIGPDEPRYAEVAREMYVTGDWITPRLGGIDWFEKPALTYWISAAGYQLFGVSEFAARVGVALVASLGVLMLYFLGKRMRSSRFGYLSASVLVTCGLWPGFSRGATFDMPLAVSLELALLSFFLWESKEEQAGKNRLWWIFSFALGLALLAKGLVGIVLPLAIIGPYLLLTRRLKVVFKAHLLFLGVLIVLLTAATWYLPVIARHGKEFINEFFIAHHFQRYLSNKYRHPQPFYFFLLVVFLGSFPWSFHLVANAFQTLREWRAATDLPNRRLRLFLWLWVLVPILFFSFSGSKLPGYILPVFPAIALIIGSELERWWMEKDSRRMNLLAISTGLFIIGVAVGVGLRGDEELGLNLFAAFRLATVAIVIAVVYLGLWMIINGRAATLFLPFGLALVVITVVTLVFPVLGQRESLRDLSLVAKRNARPGERLVFYVTHDQGINFYATDLPLRDERSELVTVVSPEAVLSLMEANGGESILVFSRKRWSDGVASHKDLQAEKLGEQKSSVSCSPDCEWVLLRVRRSTLNQQQSRLPDDYEK